MTERDNEQSLHKSFADLIQPSSSEEPSQVSQPIILVAETDCDDFRFQNPRVVKPH